MISKVMCVVLLLVLTATAQSYPRVVRRQDGKVVRVWCDSTSCSRDAELVPENKIKKHWWQFRRHIVVDYDMRGR